METRKGFVVLTKRPRPDHPGERQPIAIREDLIGLVQVEQFNYTPDGKAPVALLPNAKILSGEATFVYTVTGGAFCVIESPDEVLRKVAEARDPAAVQALTGYTPVDATPPQLKVVES